TTAAPSTPRASEPARVNRRSSRYWNAENELNQRYRSRFIIQFAGAPRPAGPQPCDGLRRTQRRRLRRHRNFCEDLLDETGGRHTGEARLRLDDHAMRDDGHRHLTDVLRNDEL